MTIFFVTLGFALAYGTLLLLLILMTYGMITTDVPFEGIGAWIFLGIITGSWIYVTYATWTLIRLNWGSMKVTVKKEKPCQKC